jgi:hypothetical protein
VWYNKDPSLLNGPERRAWAKILKPFTKYKFFVIAANLILISVFQCNKSFVYRLQWIIEDRRGSYRGGYNRNVEEGSGKVH